MPGVCTLKWRDGREENLFGHRGYYYVLPDQTILSFLPDPAWCRHCDRITLCEHLQTPAAIQKQLSDLADPASKRSLELARMSTANFSETWIKKLQVGLQHATLRKLPPSCLECGYREVAYFIEGQWAPHPKTGEEVLFYFSGMCSTNYAKKFYDTDCNPLDITDEQKAALWDAVRHNKDI